MLFNTNEQQIRLLATKGFYFGLSGSLSQFINYVSEQSKVIKCMETISIENVQVARYIAIFEKQSE